MKPKIFHVSAALAAAVVCLCSGIVPARAFGTAPADAGAAAQPAQPVKEKIGGHYKWDSPEDQKRYENALWDRIVTARLSGLAPGATLVEKKTEVCGARGQETYLRKEGALCPVGVWLEEKGASSGKIDSIDKLKARFAPVESETEAASFVSVTQFDLKVSDSDVLVGHTLAIDGGYLVQAVAKNSFGCRAHIPTGIIFKVSKSGDIKHIAGEEEPKPKEPVLCTD